MMKKPLSIALAASIAVTAIGLSAAPAAARDRHWHNNDTGAAIAALGIVVGLAAIAAANQHRYDTYYGYPPPPRYYGTYRHFRGYSPHVAWCLDRYRTYNPATNTYFRKPGVPAVCRSPF